jgi:endonuclease YncB( thermonuclease family)
MRFIQLVAAASLWAFALTPAAQTQAPAVTATHIYAADVLTVLDGDSFRVRVDLGLDTARVIDVRVRNLFAPEKNTEQGKAVKAAAIRLLYEHGSRVLLRTVKVGPEQRDDKSFARYVCEVWLPTGQSYADALKARVSWTDNGIGGGKR